VLSETPFARQVADALRDTSFTVLDVGGTGANAVWNFFGKNLHLVTTGSRIRVSGDGETEERMRSGRYWARNPWGRLSVARTLELRAAASNTAVSAPIADTAPAQAVVTLPDDLTRLGLGDCDFIVLSAGGPDFLILRSLGPFLNDANVLGVSMIVNFFGSSAEGVHTFHNVDRFMKDRGFELFSLTTRRYSMAALPAPYEQSSPGQTLWGRLLQGDALYLRDAAAPEHIRWALTAGGVKLVKLAALFSMAGLPDCAAELIASAKPALESLLDLKAGLEKLTLQCIGNGDVGLTYPEYIARFEADNALFYPDPSSV
jgi:hypothetical protein